MSEKTTTTHEPAPQGTGSAQEAESAAQTRTSSSAADGDAAAEQSAAPSQPSAPDAQLAAQDEFALAALRALVPAEEIGQGHRVRAEGELAVTHLFPADKRGYRGWEWYVTIARVPGSEQATVCESGMLPGDDALLAPEWVPWSERMTDSDQEDSEHGGSDQEDSDREDLGQDGSDHADAHDQEPDPADSEDADPERRADGRPEEDDPSEATGIDTAP